MRVCPRCRSIYASRIQRCGIDRELLIDQPNDPLVGTVLDRYKLEELLGVGAMGCVYRAKHTVIEREYAIKVLFGDFATDPKFMKRFVREAQSISKIRHQNIVTVDDFGSVPNGPTFFAMELVKGTTLERAIERGAPFTPQRSAGIVRQIASGLGEAHDKGYIHRDVKPSNIMLSLRKGLEFVKILDFGAVSLMSAPPTSARLTNVGHIIGTPTYMAPEQSQDPAVGPTADLYALGVLLFEMLTGSPPFTGRGRAEVLVKHIMEEPPSAPPSQGLEHIVARLLQKLPERRYTDANELIGAIDALGLNIQVFKSGSIEAPIFSQPIVATAGDKADTLNLEAPTPPEHPAQRFDSIPTRQVEFSQDQLSSKPSPSGSMIDTFPALADPNPKTETPEWSAWNSQLDPAPYNKLSGDLQVTDRSQLPEAAQPRTVSTSGEQNLQTQVVRERIVPRDVPLIDSAELISSDGVQVLQAPTSIESAETDNERQAETTQVDFQMHAFAEGAPITTEVADNPVPDLAFIAPTESGLYAPPQPLFQGQEPSAPPDSAITQIDPSFPTYPGEADQGFALAQTLAQEDSAPQLDDILNSTTTPNAHNTVGDPAYSPKLQPDILPPPPSPQSELLSILPIPTEAEIAGADRAPASRSPTSQRPPITGGLPAAISSDAPTGDLLPFNPDYETEDSDISAEAKVIPLVSAIVDPEATQIDPDVEPDGEYSERIEAGKLPADALSTSAIDTLTSSTVDTDELMPQKRPDVQNPLELSIVQEDIPPKIDPASSNAYREVQAEIPNSAYPIPKLKPEPQSKLAKPILKGVIGLLLIACLVIAALQTGLLP